MYSPLQEPDGTSEIHINFEPNSVIKNGNIIKVFYKII